MATLEEIRQQYPQYNDLSDAQLADSIYKKHYSDMPREQFDAKIGLQAPPMPPETKAESLSDYIPRAITDVPKEIGNAFSEGVAGVKSGLLNRDPTKESGLESILRTGGGLLSAASIPFSPLVGAGRSLLGHPLASASEYIGSILNPEVKDSHEKIYEDMKPGVDKALSAIAANRPVYGPPTPPQQSPLLKAVSTLKDQGHEMSVPRVVASDSRLAHMAGERLKDAPLIGAPIVEKSEQTVQQLANVRNTIADAQGGRTMESAGSAASEGLKGWIGPKSKALVTKAYDAVDAVVDPAIRTDLATTRAKIAEIAAERQNSMIPGDSAAVGQVLDAVQNPGGLNYKGIKGLRTYFGEMLENPSLLPSGWSGGEAKRIYAGLSEDLKTAANAAGGPRGLQLFERANKLNSAVAARREQLAKVVGLDGKANDALVFDRIKAAASSKSRADTGLLMKARQAIGSEWEEVVSGVTAQLGKNAKGDFSPAIYLNNWNALSDAGKSALYGTGTHRKSLDAVAEISHRIAVDLEKFRNTSNTGKATWTSAAALAAYNDPLTTLAAAVGANVTARVMASPAPAASFAQWSKAYAAAHRAPSPKSASLLTIASRNLANTINSSLGLSVAPTDLLRPIGTVPVKGEEE